MFERVTSKDAIFILSKGDSRSWWFNNGEGLFVIDYLPDNWPELEAGIIFPVKGEGLKRAREMVDGEGWTVSDGKIPIDVSSFEYSFEN